MNTARLEYQLGKANLALPSKIVKRNTATVTFDVNRIERAIQKCFDELDPESSTPGFTAGEVTERVAQTVANKYVTTIPTVEQVQDIVETTLIALGEGEAARSYIRYRINQAHERGGARAVPDHVREAFEFDSQFFDSPSQKFVFYDKYSRFNFDLNRRETWPETVQRTVDHLRWETLVHAVGVNGGDTEYAATLDTSILEKLVNDNERLIDDETFKRIQDAIALGRIAPSMRLFAMAGDAAKRNSMAIYNCSYLPIKDIQSYVETMLISMAGCGVGFSVEREYVEQFPPIKRQKKNQVVPTHVIGDTTELWGEALRVGLEAWWNGRDVKFDDSQVRKAGSLLKTKGGRASGPEPLMTMLTNIREIVLSRQGSLLRTTDAHIIACNVGEAAVQGGVRRTAMIALFDWDDHEMRNVKSGPNMNPVLWNSNNSAVWPDDIADVDIIQQMLDMVKTKSGEPGIFSRAVANRTKPKRRKAAKFGTNPCGEILLRPHEFCNLTQAIARPGDTEEDLFEKVELATITGMIQSLSTRFPGLRPEWAQNGQEERLLGVDLTAQVDCELLRNNDEAGQNLRRRLQAHVLQTTEKWAPILGINVSAAISTNKPAGNSSERYGTASGISAWKFSYMLRNYTVGVTSPLFRVFRDAGVPMEPRAGQTAETASSWIASIPRKAPEGATVVSDLSVVDQLEYWKLNKQFWTEHNPSFTAVYKPNEIIDMIAWVVANKSIIGGLSFFPASDAIYKQAPYQEITVEEYEQKMAAFPEIDFSLIYRYEENDMTTAAQELACFAGYCEV